MGFTPEDIERREFLVALRGYDRDEVHRYLIEVAAQFREALSAPPAAEDPYTRLGEDVAELVRSTAEQSNALRAKAEDEVAALRSSAEHEVAELRAEARREADQIRADAEADAERRHSEAVDYAREQVSAVLADARERYSRADAAERELVDFLRGVASFAGDALHQLGDAPLGALLDEAVGSLVERSHDDARPPSATY